MPLTSETFSLEMLEVIGRLPVSAADREEQRRSFAYGNTVIENPRITREMIARQAERVNASRT